MADQEIPKTDSEAHTTENPVKEDPSKPDNAEEGANVEEGGDEGKTEENIEEGKQQDKDAAEGEESTVAEAESKVEGTEQPPEHTEQESEAKIVESASETGEAAAEGTSETPAEEKTEAQPEEGTEGAEGPGKESKAPPSEDIADLQDISDQGTEIEEDQISIKYDVEEQAVEDDDVEAHPLDELTDQQVIELVNEVEMENRHLELENTLFENFLKDNDATLLEGLDDIMNFLIKKTSITFGSSRDVQDKPSVSLDRQKFRLDSYTSITSIAEGKGPKINLSQKTDMVMRAMEENQANLESFLKKSHIAMRNLKSELEEFSIREAEIKEATDIFEFSVVTQGLDKLTQRIPAEKFVRYMEEWLKSAQLQIEKLRLRIATLKVQYKKVSQQLIQRQELGENVHAVDFDQLEIENKHFIEKIEQKNNHLIELKKMNGGANLVLSTHKKFLQKQQDDCNKLKLEIEYKNGQIESTEKECNETEAELNEIYEKYEHCKNLKNQYTVPDVMEYVRLKGKLHELRKNMKIWVRRRKIQDIALSTCLREMKNLTGNTNTDPEWFQDNQSLASDFSEAMLI